MKSEAELKLAAWCHWKRQENDDQSDLEMARDIEKILAVVNAARTFCLAPGFVEERVHEKWALEKAIVALNAKDCKA